MAAPQPDAAPKPEPAVASESITNTQTAGVDEGGIVKAQGEFLIVLRRGRLFTLKLGAHDLAPVAAVDAFGKGIDPEGTWYDEMLVSAHHVVVIGYSYARGGTEVGLFDLGDDGGLTYRSTYHLRSNDYYSSRNYASRLIGDKLVFYSPLYISPTEDDPMMALPAMRKWHPGATDAEWKRIASTSRVYRPLEASDDAVLHTVTTCDLSKGDMPCEATSVVGPPGDVFYVSASSVYVWTSVVGSGTAAAHSLVYRMPLDGSAPSVLAARGAPVDQFSFLETSDGFLDVVVRAGSAGDAMWQAEGSSGSVAMLRIPLSSFSKGDTAAPKSDYHALPTPDGNTFQNRFVGDNLLYGMGNGWGTPEDHKDGAVYVYPVDAEHDVTKVALTHGVDRIEALGTDAVVVGSDQKDL